MQCQKTQTFWNSFSKTYMYYVPIRLNDLYLPSKFYMDRTFEMIRYFCHFCCLLLLHTEPWPGCLGDTAAAPPLSQPLPSCWDVYPLSTINLIQWLQKYMLHLPQMFIWTNKKTFVFAFWELSFLHLQKFKINVILIKIHLRIPLKKFIKNLHFLKNWNVLQK